MESNWWKARGLVLTPSDGLGGDGPVDDGRSIDTEGCSAQFTW